MANQELRSHAGIRTSNSLNPVKSHWRGNNVGFFFFLCVFFANRLAPK